MRHRFIADFRDQSATSRTGLQPMDGLSTLALLLGTSLQLIEQFTKFLTTQTAVSPAVLSICISAIWIVWSAAVIQAKISPERNSNESDYLLLERATYQYAPLTRNVAKIVFVASITLLAFPLSRVYAQTRPLPNSFYGYLLDTSNHPRAGLRLEVVSRNGRLLAASRYETDDRGFYIIRARHRIPRDARLRVKDATTACGAGDLLPLTPGEQIDPSAGPTLVDAKAVVFRHRIPCSSEP